MTHPLDGAHVKVARAYEHLDALQAEIDGGIDQFMETAPGAPDMFGFRPAPGDWWEVAVKPIAALPPARWGAIAADALANTRAALDYLVYELVTAATGKPPKRSAFPIVDHVNEWDKVIVNPPDPEDSPLFGLAPDSQAVALIRAAQPFNHPIDAGSHGLVTLRRLTNRDKHRTIVVNGLWVDLTTCLTDVVRWGDHVTLLEHMIVHNPLSTTDYTLVARLKFDGNVNPEFRLQYPIPVAPTIGDSLKHTKGARQIQVSVVRGIVFNVDHLLKVAHDMV